MIPSLKFSIHNAFFLLSFHRGFVGVYSLPINYFDLLNKRLTSGDYANK